jgi:hypothetical protein
MGTAAGMDHLIDESYRQRPTLIAHGTRGA